MNKIFFILTTTFLIISTNNQEVEERFLNKYYKQMPRTMLRYSIERFSEEKRKYYMKK